MPNIAARLRPLLRNVVVAVFIAVVMATAMLSGGALAVMGFATLVGYLKTAVPRERPAQDTVVLSPPSQPSPHAVWGSARR